MSNNQSHPIHSQGQTGMNACSPVCIWLHLSSLTQFKTHYVENGTAHSSQGLPIPINLRQSPTDVPQARPIPHPGSLAR